MFKVATTPKFDTPVKVKAPSGTGGHTTHTFTATFRVTDTDRIASLLNEIREEREAASEAILPTADKRVIEEHLVGWDGVVNSDTDRPIPLMIDGTETFTDAAKAVIGLPYVLTGLIDAFYAAVSSGRYKAKN